MQPLHLATSIMLFAAFVGGCGASASSGASRRAKAITDDDRAFAAHANAVGAFERGLGTWYGPGFAGKPTANGETFDPRAMTAAHRTLPFDTVVDVTRLDTGRTVRVRINDRGPWDSPRKIIDLAQAAAERLDIPRVGYAKVEVRVVKPAETSSRR